MRRLARRDALLGQADAAELQGRSGENPRQAAHRVAARSGADVIVLELEDFTPPELRPKARSLSPRTLELWRKAGAIPAVRINPLQSGGLEDLMGVLAARPQIIMMAKVALPEQVQALEQATGGAVELVPNVESAEGLLRAYQIAKAINRVFTPGRAELLRARKVVAAFEKARKAGKDRATVGGALIELPIYAAAKRLLESAARSSPPRRKKSR